LHLVFLILFFEGTFFGGPMPHRPSSFSLFICWGNSPFPAETAPSKGKDACPVGRMGLPSDPHRCQLRAWCCSCLSCRDSSWLGKDRWTVSPHEGLL
jgi:hypothetical protein